MNKLFQTITCSRSADSISGGSFAKAESDAEYSRLIIHDLELLMMIGIHAHELKEKQQVVVNVLLDVKPYTQWESDDILDVISYEVVVNKIIDLAKSQHFNLVENFAGRIAGICLDDPRCLKVKVRIEKPEAISETRAVGIEITRLQQN